MTDSKHTTPWKRKSATIIDPGHVCLLIYVLIVDVHLGRSDNRRNPGDKKVTYCASNGSWLAITHAAIITATPEGSCRPVLTGLCSLTPSDSPLLSAQIKTHWNGDGQYKQDNIKKQPLASPAAMSCSLVCSLFFLSHLRIWLCILLSLRLLARPSRQFASSFPRPLAHEALLAQLRCRAVGPVNHRIQLSVSEAWTAVAQPRAPLSGKGRAEHDGG